jgi:hypothetical protein
MAGQADSLKSVLFALFANTAIAIARGIAAYFTKSGAMLAVKARMVPAGSEAGMIRAVNHVGSAFRAAFPMTAWLFFEPDTED